MRLLFKKKLLLIFFALATSFSLLLGLFVLLQVGFGNTKYLEKTAILSKIREETTIYFLDEKAQIGSLFDRNHRKYTPITEVPSHFLDAVVAAEDKNFYEHRGVDFVALSRAFVAGIVKGRFRRGASSITQQTVKNIVNDWEASFTRKFREMIRALQLERLYSKQQILEFYINQFYVVRNGNGIGIAARYYFNKKPSELNLVESAFIAGSLKGPGKYNPFVKSTKEAKKRAIAFAMDRKNYVLGRMHEQGWISTEVYEETKRMSIPFNQGDFSNSEVALVTLIKKQLNKKEILAAIGLSSKEDLNIAGYKIYSTIDENLQNYYQRAMRQNLSRVETILSEFSPEDPDQFKTLKTLKEGSFVYGKIEDIQITQNGKAEIDLSFGYPKGQLTYNSIVDQAKLLSLSNRSSYKDQLKYILNNLKVGDVVFCEVKSYNKKKNQAELLLRKTPRVSGGLIAIDKGEVRALVSGFDTLGYNRALFAKRQPGSLFKSFVFYAALQLGWTVTDTLNNTRKIFPYQGNLYAPRPDHPIHYESSSLLWTGVMSENIASISLLEDFLAKLNFDQFQRLLAFLDLAPKEEETERDFHYRLSRKTGVSLDHDGIKEHLLSKAIHELIPDLIFGKEEKTISKLKELWWGKGHEYALAHLEEENTKEAETKSKLLENNFLHLKRNYEQFKQDWNLIALELNMKGLSSSLSDQEDFLKALDRFRIIESKNKQQLVHYTAVDLEGFLEEGKKEPEENLLSPFSDMNQEDSNLLGLLNYRNKDTNQLNPLSDTNDDKSEEEEEVKIQTKFHFAIPVGRKLTPLDVKRYWKQENFFKEEPYKKTLLHGYLKVEHFERLSDSIENDLKAILNYKDPYSLNKYYHHHDFRIALALGYLKELAKEMGVFSEIRPVLSLPLGSSELTVGEIAKIYQTVLNGKTYSYHEEGPKNQLNFIKRIEDRFGNTLYEPTRTEHQLTSDSVTVQAREILRKTMSHGTGRRSRRDLYLTPDKSRSKIRIPTFGKTGTTNDFTTSYFAGSMPYPVEFGKPLEASNSYTVATYIGYDDNTNMQKGFQKIYGSSGAMPLWIQTLKETIKIKKYNSYFDPFDLSVLSRGEWPLHYPEKTKPYLIDLPRGITLREGKEADKDIYRIGHEKLKDGYYQDIFIPDLSSNSILYLPEEPTEEKLSLFKRK